MDFTYKTATLEDIDILVTTRIEVLRAANKLDDQADMSEVAVQSRDYYEKALRNGSHTAILVYDKDQIVGAGGKISHGIKYYIEMKYSNQNQLLHVCIQNCVCCIPVVSIFFKIM